MSATSCIQPIDTVKVRIQIISQQISQGKIAPGEVTTSPMSVAKDIMNKDGITGFYKGLDSALARQILYGTARLGLFRTFSDYMKEKNGRNLYLYEKAGCSLTAGFIASIIGNPADLALVRFQTDSTLPVE